MYMSFEDDKNKIYVAVLANLLEKGIHVYVRIYTISNLLAQ